ncbi:MAG: polysaccharide deacetylase family protein [Pyrinomonadaceae bacterium]
MHGPILFYHKIDFPPADAKIRGGYTPAKRFDRQMGWLKRQGYDFYPAATLAEYYLQNGVFPPNGIAVSFDDGWMDNYTNAFPVLKKYGIPATIFLIPSVIGTSALNAQSEGESPHPHLTLQQIREMSAAGIEFGSHSLTHRLMHQLSVADLKVEAEESKVQIESLLDKPCRVFAYPGGHNNQNARQAVQAAGYIAGFSTIHGPTDHLETFALNRKEILRRDRFSFQFARKVKPLIVPS